MKKDTRTKSKSSDKDIIIGSNLLYMRQMKNISQAQLAERVGVSFQQIQKYEKGINRISAATLYDISQILEVDLQDFFRNIADENPPCRSLDKNVERAKILFQSIESEDMQMTLLNFMKQCVKQQKKIWRLSP